MKKKLAYFCIAALFSVLLLTGCGKNANKNNPNYNSDNYLSGTHYVVMDVKNYGEIYFSIKQLENNLYIVNENI